MGTASALRRGRVTFQSRSVTDDGMGNEVSGDWEPRCTVSATFKPLRGGEDVLATRLTGVQPYVVTVRQSPQTRAVTEDWRMVDDRDASRIFNIRAIHDPDNKRKWLEMLVHEGVAT